MSWRKRLDLGAVEATSMARRGTLATVSVFLQGLARFAYSILVGRLLTPAALAAVNSAISLALFTSLLYPTATGTAATKFVARARGAGDEPLVHGIARHLGRVAMATSSALGAAVGSTSYLLLRPGDVLDAVLTGGLVVAWSMYTFVRGLQFAVQQVRRATVWDGISAATSIVLLVAVLAAGFEALLLLPLIIGYAVYALAGIPRRAERRAPSAPLRREMHAFIAWVTVEGLAGAGLLQLSMVIAGLVGTPVEAGWYAAALAIATPASLLARSFSLVLFPGMAAAAGRGDEASIAVTAVLATRGLIAAMGAVFGALVIGAEPAIAILFGQRYVGGAPILVVLLTAVFLVTIGIAAINGMAAASGRSVRVPAFLSLGGLTVGLLVMWAGAGAGVIGIAIGYLAGATVIGLGPIVLLAAAMRRRWVWIFPRALLGAGVAAGAAWVSFTVGGLLVAAGCAATFLLCWVGIMLPEVRMITSLRRGPSPEAGDGR